MDEKSPYQRTRERMKMVHRASPTGSPFSIVKSLGRIGLLSLRHYFTTKTETLPGRLATHDPGPCAASVWWAGHATCLIGLSGKWFLTDPNLSLKNGSLLRRIAEPGFTKEHLPPLDGVVVSHAHLDHMDMPTLLGLKGASRLLVPPGCLNYVKKVRRNGAFDQMAELAHWESVQAGNVRITAVPAVHDGWRFGVDALYMNVHASGFVFESEEATVYYTGDTAYDPNLFREIGEKFKIDVLICPIGPLKPRWLMKLVHVDSTDAFRILEDTGASWMVPVHHNTFPQSLDEPTDITDEFFRVRSAHLLKDRVRLLRPGEQPVFDNVNGELVLTDVRSAYPKDFINPRIPGDDDSV